MKKSISTPLGRYGGHLAAVQAWLKTAGDGLPQVELVDLLERALNAVWDYSRATVSEITLVAVLERVIAIAQEDQPWTPALALKANRPDFSALRAAAAPAKRGEALRLVEIVLVEHLAILGALTGEMLTPGLYRALSSVGRTKHGRS